jgi:excisionase family DNA binding protein
MSEHRPVHVPPVLLPVKGVCKHFGLSPATVYRWLAAGLIESVHVGRSRYVIVASVYAYIESLRHH